MAGMTRALGGRSGAGADLRAMTRPDSSIGPNPYTTLSGTVGTSGAATGRRRAVPSLPCSRLPGRARGAVVAPPRGERPRRTGGAAASEREPVACLSVRAMSGLKFDPAS